MEMNLVDYIGYLAMATLLVSFMMKSVTRLRIINSIGCAIFVLYGFMLEPIAMPIIVTNGAIILINLYYLFFAPKSAQE